MRLLARYALSAVQLHILRPLAANLGRNRSDRRVDRRKRLSHFGAQGLAFLWGRRFRLPTGSFTASSLLFSQMAKSSGARTRACRVETRLDTLVAYGHSVVAERRHECRRGTHECVRHSITAERLVEMPARPLHQPPRVPSALRPNALSAIH